MTMTKLFAGIAIAAFCSASVPAFADNGLTSVVGPSVWSNSDNQDWSLGWSFSTTGETITALGYNDQGFSGTHEVGIFNASGILLTSASVTSSSTLNDGYRYTSVAPVDLVAGIYYISGTTLGLNDGWTYQASSWANNAQTNYLGSYFTDGVGGNLNFPSTYADSRQYFEVNFQTPGVPEPATWAMFLVGFGALGFMMRGSRRKATAVTA